MTPERLAALEAERYDTSYRHMGKKPAIINEPLPIQTVVKPCLRKHVVRQEQEHRDQMMFHAGRYAAGARDVSSERAQEWLLADLEKENDD